MAAAAMTVAVVLAAVVAAAATAEVRWEVAYLTVEPLGPAQKARTSCRHHLCFSLFLCLCCLKVLDFYRKKKVFDLLENFTCSFFFALYFLFTPLGFVRS